MFYLVTKKNESLREHEDKMALRRIKRKQEKPDTLRIIEGKSLKKALEREAKAEVKEVAPVAKKKAKRVKKEKAE